MTSPPGGCKVAVEMEIQKRQLVAKDKELEMARANLNIQKANAVRRPRRGPRPRRTPFTLVLRRGTHL